MAHIEWRLTRQEDNAAEAMLRLTSRSDIQRMTALGLIVNELGNKAFIQPVDGDRPYYNYKITLTSGTDFDWLNSTVPDLLVRLGGVMLY